MNNKNNFPDDFNFDSDDAHNEENPIRKEEREIKNIIECLNKKIGAKGAVLITNRDIFQYMRVINYNFATLQRMVHAIYTRESLVEQEIADFHKKLDTFIETSELLTDALGEDNESRSDSKDDTPFNKLK